MLLAETKEYASEAAHWYRKDGTTCHQLPYKDKKRKGELRNTTLRDARELGLLPSTSGILKIVDKPGLRNWRDRQIAQAAWCISNPDMDGPSMDEFAERAIERAVADMDVARDTGSEIHGWIDRYFKEIAEEHYYRIEDYIPHGTSHGLHVKAAVDALKDLGVSGHPYRSERSFAAPQYGFGGCVDFSTEEIVVDYKAVTRLEKKLTYWDRAAQLASYSMGIHGKIVRCANIFIDNTTAEYHVHEWSREDLEHGWSVFLACLNLWCLINKYDPRSLSVTSS